jgi:hypothetical protein
MQVTELEPDVMGYPECITGTPTETNGERSQGTLHLSTIYRDMETVALQQRRNEVTKDELAFYAAGGYLWERVFSMAHREAVQCRDLVRPNEWELDGIVGSPDAIRVPEWRLVELKFRWASSNKFDNLEKHFWLELLQIKGYLKMIGATEAELWVFFCNGDWRPPRPCVRGVMLEFDQQEIDEAWAMIKNHAERRGWL